MTDPTDPAPPDPSTETPPADPAAQDDPKPTETVDYWKKKSRENEARAKANAKAAEQLAAIEEANKTEAQRSADALAAANKAAEDAKADALRYRIASKFQVSDEDAELFLTGADEETLTRQAQRLTGMAEERKKHGNKVPREGTNPPPVSAGTDAAFARELLSGG